MRSPRTPLPASPRPRSLYDETVGCMDAAIGRVLEALEASAELHAASVCGPVGTSFHRQ